jgi:hypothetical protein
LSGGDGDLIGVLASRHPTLRELALDGNPGLGDAGCAAVLHHARRSATIARVSLRRCMAGKVGTRVCRCMAGKVGTRAFAAWPER